METAQNNRTRDKVAHSRVNNTNCYLAIGIFSPSQERS